VRGDMWRSAEQVGIAYSMVCHHAYGGCGHVQERVGTHGGGGACQQVWVCPGWSMQTGLWRVHMVGWVHGEGGTRHMRSMQDNGMCTRQWDMHRMVGHAQDHVGVLRKG
jgi:hypothetical protein